MRTVRLTDEQFAALTEVLEAALDTANHNAEVCRPKDLADVLQAKSMVYEMMEAMDSSPEGA